VPDALRSPRPRPRPPAEGAAHQSRGSSSDHRANRARAPRRPREGAASRAPAHHARAPALLPAPPGGAHRVSPPIASSAAPKPSSAVPHHARAPPTNRGRQVSFQRRRTERNASKAAPTTQVRRVEGARSPSSSAGRKESRRRPSPPIDYARSLPQLLLLCSVLVLVFSSTNFLLLCACDLLLCYTTFSGQVNFIVIWLKDFVLVSHNAFEL
jgi:hypothetical protein